MNYFRKNFARVACFVVLTLLVLDAPASAAFRLRVTPTGTSSLGTNLDPDSSPFVKASLITCQVTNTGGSAAAHWYLKIYGTGNFASVSTPSRTMPLSRLEWKLNSGSTYATMTTTAAAVVDSTSTGTLNYPIDFRLTVSWSDPSASDYRGTLSVTLTDTP